MQTTPSRAPAPALGLTLLAAVAIMAACALLAPRTATAATAATARGAHAPLAAAPAPSGGSEGSAAAAAGGTVDASGPYQLVKTAASTLLEALQAHREEYRRDPAKLRALVQQTLLPHFDTQLAARLVLGRYWRMASPDQRMRFVTAFYNSLLNNYGNALLDLTANSMQVLPYRGKPSGTYTTVDTRVRKADGSMVAVNYSLDKTAQGWKVWDVVVEGISYDKSFQQDFSEQLQREGIEAVISRLEHGETPAAIKHTTGA
ncbi:MAG TPA: ABC transporter substrate-binding protein [Terriglobales bacterium]|nr:ABC transporter substrate-binding protein [Terriglobales bacterium]